MFSRSSCAGISPSRKAPRSASVSSWVPWATDTCFAGSPWRSFGAEGLAGPWARPGFPRQSARHRDAPAAKHARNPSANDNRQLLFICFSQIFFSLDYKPRESSDRFRPHTPVSPSLGVKNPVRLMEHGFGNRPRSVLLETDTEARQLLHVELQPSGREKLVLGLPWDRQAQHFPRQGNADRFVPELIVSCEALQVSQRNSIRLAREQDVFPQGGLELHRDGAEVAFLVHLELE